MSCRDLTLGQPPNWNDLSRSSEIGTLKDYLLRLWRFVTSLRVCAVENEDAITALTARVVALEQGLVALTARVETLETTAADHETRIGDNETAIADHETRITALEP